MENQQQQTNLCRANCGFYGSPATEDLCSKCFKDMIKRKQETGNTGAGVVQTQPAAVAASPAGSGTVSSASTSESAAHVIVGKQSVELQPEAIASQTLTEVAQKKPNRCWVCNKRIGLTGFECRCGGHYCGEHRYDNSHDCTFDYKAAGREELRTKNPKVVTDKIQKI